MESLRADEAERSLLGAVLLDPGAADRVLSYLGEDDFGSYVNRLIYRAVAENAQKGRAVDSITLTDTLRRWKVLDQVGGAAALAALAAEAEGTANVETYARIVREKARLRRALAAVNAAAERIKASEKPPDDLLDEVEALVFRATEDRRGEGPFRAGDILEPVVERIEEMSERKDAYTGLPVGLADFDKVTSGLQKGNFVVLAARPSMGKTSLALSWIRHVALERKRGVLFFSLEMSETEVLLRLISQASGIAFWRLRDGRIEASDWTRIIEAVEKIGEAPLWIDVVSGLTPLEVRAKTRRVVREAESQGKTLDMVVVDYLQLMSPSVRADNRQQEVAQISRSLKGLALETGVPVVALSQLSRAPERRGDHVPQLADLRDSGAIEQDADLVLFIHRDPNDPEGAGEAELLIRKHRNGALAEIPLAFLGDVMRFESLYRGDDTPEEFVEMNEEG